MISPLLPVTSFASSLTTKSFFDPPLSIPFTGYLRIHLLLDLYTPSSPAQPSLHSVAPSNTNKYDASQPISSLHPTFKHEHSSRHSKPPLQISLCVQLPQSLFPALLRLPFAPHSVLSISPLITLLTRLSPLVLKQWATGNDHFIADHKETLAFQGFSNFLSGRQ